MAIYPWGDLTGVYYLIVSGLPWSATWQKLKDFVKCPTNGNPINVEHVFIYPNATDGWIKIHGKEDFRRAYGKLITFEGKALIADDRNGIGTVNLRDIAPIQTGVTSQCERVRHARSLPGTHYAATSTAEYTTTPQLHKAAGLYGIGTYPTVEKSDSNHSINYPPAPPTPPSSSGQRFYGTDCNPSSVSYSANVHFDYSSTAPQAVYLTSAASIYAEEFQLYPMYLMPLGPFMPSPPPTQYNHPALALAVEERHQFVQEARKIIITHLPHSITEKELQSLLERASQRSHRSKSQAPTDGPPIEHFELLKEANGKVRGHAFATFYSATIAKRVVDNLDGKVYQRRELKVRLTKEGVESVRRTSPVHQSVTASASPTREQSIYSESSYNPSELSTQMNGMTLTPNTNYSSTYSNTEPKKERREKGARRSDADSERDRGKEQRGKSSHHFTRTLNVPEIGHSTSSSTKPAASVPAPVVVDGSSRRRHK